MRIHFAGWLAGTIACGALVSGCKDDPPPPPLPPPPSATVADVKARPVDATMREAPAFSDATGKRFRVELCRYGALGLQVSHEAYLASLAGKEPSAERLPSFGEFPENDDGSAKDASPVPSAAPGATAAASGQARTMPRIAPSVTLHPPVPPPAAVDPSLLATRLPFTRYLGACAPSPGEAADEGIDKALIEFQPYAMELQRDIVAAQRYYGTKQHEQDKFERGKASHKELLARFGELDAKLAAFGKAFDAWETGLGHPPEKLDKAGEVAFTALGKARALAALVFADKLDADALKKAHHELFQAKTALEAAGNEDAKSPHPLELVPRLSKLLDASSEAQRAAKAGVITTKARYLVAWRMTDVVEADHRALAQLLRMTGQTRPSGPLTTVRPRIDSAIGDRPDLRVRPRPTAEPTPPPANDPE